MITIHDINDKLRQLLLSQPVTDYGYNGIQVENTGAITKVAFCVDASLESIKATIEVGANLLVVHHGFFWGRELPINGSHYERIKLMIENNVGLIAYHLPLDGHPEYGNNAQILSTLGAVNVERYGSYKGFDIGCIGELPEAKSVAEIATALAVPAESCKILNFRGDAVRRVGVVSGGGGSHFSQFVERGVDLFITGDSEHVMYHQAKEAGVDVLFAGHYYTETFGVKALQRFVDESFGLESCFLDIPTGL